MIEVFGKREDKKIYLKHDRLRFWEEWASGKNPEELARMITHFEELSTTDALTQTLNDRGLEEEINKIDIVSKNQETHLLIIFADVDNLKKTNDSFGHPEGSARLVKVANLLKMSLTTNDIIGRYGGDEFLIFIKENDEGRFDIHLKKIQEALEGKESVSIGYKLWNSNRDGNIRQGIKEADDDMYQTKNSLPDHSGKSDGVEFIEI
jgi:diguanylate cyclase (GGDEF)-like protein